MKILVVHPNFQAGGGAERAAMRLIDCLGAMPLSVDCLDIHGLGAGRVPSRRGRLVGFLAAACPVLLAYALVCRKARKLAKHYDRIIWSFGEGPDLAIPALAWHHAPSVFDPSPEMLRAQTGVDRKGIRLRLRQIYVRMCRRIAGIGSQQQSQTQRLANSEWTAEIAGHAFPGVKFHLLYPPVSGCILPARQNVGSCRLVVLGRIVANKRIAEAIEISDILQAAGVPVQLDIIGRGRGRALRQVEKLCARRAHVSLHLDPPDDKCRKLLRRADFAIHSFRGEHFGIAAAEEILAGTIPLVFDDGGICELVPDPRLRFHTSLRAAENILALVMAGPQKQATTLAALRNGAAFLAARNFDRVATRILAQWLELPKDMADAA